MTPLDFLEPSLHDLERSHLLRIPRSHAELPAEAVWLCSNDYLGLAERSTSARGAGGAGASALVWGYGPPHAAAERALAAYAGVEACLLFSSGYAANVGALQALAAPGDLILSDALNHASIIDGARLSGARVVVVPHLDLGALETSLRLPGRRRLVVTESYFSMDGDGPDLPAVAALCKAAGAVLVVDEAHALGVLGPEGRGRCADAGVVPDVLVGTLGKSFGLAGAFVGGSRSLRTWLWNRARSFVFSTAMPPAMAHAAALRVPEILAANDARQRVLVLAERFRDLLQGEVGRRPGGFGPILPLLVGSPEAAIEMASNLRSEGWVVQPMRPPTVPTGTSRLRLTVRATLDEAQLVAASRAIGRAFRTASSAPAPTRASRPTRRIIAVVGTGTEVGKTFVASSLVECLAGLDVRVTGRKPIESGVEGELGPDQARLSAFSAVLPGSPAPFRFRRAVSPHLAAREEGRQIDLTTAARWSLDGDAEVFVVESAGALLSPLGGGATNLDLVRALAPDAILLVGADRLGILHEVGSAKLVLASKDLWDRTLVCLSAPAQSDASTTTNAAELRSLAIADRVVEWPRNHGRSSAAQTWSALQSRLERFT